MKSQSASHVPGLLKPAVAILAMLFLAGPSLRGGGPRGRQAASGHEAPLVIIPNIDDDDGDGRPDFEAEALNAAIDDELLRIAIAADVPLPEGAVLRVDIPAAWAEHLKILRLDPADKMFRPVRGALKMAGDEAGPKGVALGLEAGAFAGPGRPRSVEIGLRFETKAGALVSKKLLACSIAPFTMSGCLDPGAAVHVIRTPLTERFVDDLRPAVESAGAKLLAFAAAGLPEHDIWIQDATEIGFAAAGGRTMHVALHGIRGRELDDLFAKSFLGKNSAVVHPGGFRGKAMEWIDWFGNLEVSPPVQARDRSYPNGRVYAGTQGVRAMHPEVIGFLEAQGAQAPVLWLDTSWLIIGHVDETVSWVPSDVGRAFRMLVPSPRLALEILEKAEKASPGGLLNRGTKRPDSEKDEFCDAPISAVLGDRALLEDQAFVQRKIDGVRRTLQDELGIADADIIEIPVLFSSSPGRFAGRYGALTTNMVNSLLVGKTFIVPDPHGPLVDGTDVLLQAVKDRLEPLGCRVLAVDNFYPYHRYGGEIHCGTNVTRNPPASR